MTGGAESVGIGVSLGGECVQRPGTFQDSGRPVDKFINVTVKGNGVLFLKPGLKIRAFTLEKCLGKGGMSTVWRASHGETGERYALKILHGAVVDDEDARQRFVEEGLIQARISHPNVVSVKGRIEAHPVHALVMGYREWPNT